MAEKLKVCVNRFYNPYLVIQISLIFTVTDASSSFPLAEINKPRFRFYIRKVFHGSERGVIPEIVSSRSSNCIKEVNFIFSPPISHNVEECRCQSYCFFWHIFSCIVYGQSITPASYPRPLWSEKRFELPTIS